jgi:hypothetical protein
VSHGQVDAMIAHSHANGGVEQQACSGGSDQHVVLHFGLHGIQHMYIHSIA